jgi:hypothetical protein
MTLFPFVPVTIGISNRDENRPVFYGAVDGMRDLYPSGYINEDRNS